MPTIDVNGVSLAYEEDGTGESIVFVHGGISDHRIWQYHRRVFGRTHRAIAYSCRYHWPNLPASPGAKQSVLEHVDDLQALLTALAAAPAHLVGNSFGGLLCVLVAFRAPELVRSLVLLEPFVLPYLVSVPPRPLELFRLALRHPRTAAAVVHFGARGLAPAQAAFKRGHLDQGMQIFTRAVLGRAGLEQMTDARREQARNNLETFASQLTQAEFPSLDAEDLARITIPTLLLSGEKSPSLMRELTDRLEERLPQATRVIIPGASHDAHVDNPSAVTDAIHAFLRLRTQSHNLS